MAEKDTESISDVEGWRAAVVILIFIVVGALFNMGVEHVDVTLKNMGLRGLRHTFQKLKEEMLTLGFISLLLAASGDSISSTGLVSAHVVHQEHIFVFTLAFSHIVFASCALALTVLRMRGWKRWELSNHTLRVESLTNLSGLATLPEAENTARASGKDNATPKRFKTLRWRTPKMFQPRNLSAAERTELYLRVKRRVQFQKTTLGRFWVPFTSLFQESVTEPVYLGLRRLFVARMDVHDSFDVLSFVLESMEEEFSEVVGLSGPMWLLVAVWLVMPAQSNFPLVMSVLCLVLVIVVSLKLESCAKKLMRLSYACFTEHSSISAVAAGLLKSSREDQRKAPEESEVAGQDPIDDAEKEEREAEAVADEIINDAEINMLCERVRCESGCLSLTTGTRNHSSVDLAQHDAPASSDAEGGDAPNAGAAESGIGREARLRSLSNAVQRQQATLWKLDGGKKIDAANLFWFGKPKMLLTILNFTLFENSLSIAYLAFAYWQDQELVTNLADTGDRRMLVVVVMLVVDFVMLIHTALYVMPVYALVSSLGSHCPESVMLHASVAAQKNTRGGIGPRMQPSIKRRSSFAQMSELVQRVGSTVARRRPSITSMGVNEASYLEGPRRSSSEVQGERPETSGAVSGSDHEMNLPRISTRDLGAYTADMLRPSFDENETPRDQYDNDNTNSMTSLLGAMMKKRLESERISREQAMAAKDLEEEHERKREAIREQRMGDSEGRVASRRSLRDLFTSAPPTQPDPDPPTPTMATAASPDDVALALEGGASTPRTEAATASAPPARADDGAPESGS